VNDTSVLSVASSFMTWADQNPFALHVESIKMIIKRQRRFTKEIDDLPS
jgi:hypothetical protein